MGPTAAGSSTPSRVDASVRLAPGGESQFKVLKTVIVARQDQPVAIEATVTNDGTGGGGGAIVHVRVTASPIEYGNYSYQIQIPPIAQYEKYTGRLVTGFTAAFNSTETSSFTARIVPSGGREANAIPVEFRCWFRIYPVTKSPPTSR